MSGDMHRQPKCATAANLITCRNKTYLSSTDDWHTRS